MATTVTTSFYCKSRVVIFPSHGVFYPLSLPVSLAMPVCPTVYCHLALINVVPCTVLPDPIPGTRAKTALKDLAFLSFLRLSFALNSNQVLTLLSFSEPSHGQLMFSHYPPTSCTSCPKSLSMIPWNYSTRCSKH